MKVAEILDNECVVVKTSFHQYALGVTGVSRYGAVYKIIDQSITKKTDDRIKMLLKEVKVKNKNIKGAKNEGYGSLGRIHHDIRIMKGSELRNNLDDLHHYIQSWSDVIEK